MVSIRMARRMDKEDSPSPTAATTRVNFTKTRSQALVTTTGPMASRMLVTGPKTKWTDTACSPGRTERDTRETSSTISAKVKAHSSGQMEDNTLASGKLASSTALESTSVRMDNRGKASGKPGTKNGG